MPDLFLAMDRMNVAIDRMNARMFGVSFWQVRYRDGRIVTEGDVDWPLLPRRGLVAARLICPNGELGLIDNIEGDERIFQFKCARASMALVVEQTIWQAASMRQRDAQVLGVILDTNGTCRCHVWEQPIKGESQIVHPDGVIETRQYVRPGRLLTFEDNVWDFKYRNIGRLAAKQLGIKPD
jgi:hypothetical protein